MPNADTIGEAIAELLWWLLDLQPGMEVLDLACGHRVLANLLAARGCRVTGLDSSAVFLDRVPAADVEYVAGDMRQIPLSPGLLAAAEQFYRVRCGVCGNGRGVGIWSRPDPPQRRPPQPAHGVGRRLAVSDPDDG